MRSDVRTLWWVLGLSALMTFVGGCMRLETQRATLEHSPRVVEPERQPEGQIAEVQIDRAEETRR